MGGGEPVLVIASHTSPQQDVMVWGAISFDSRTYLVDISDTVTAHLYDDNILQPVMLAFFFATF